ncbi:MAG: hypothetical protein ACKVQR_11880 [Aquabacterium sp.]
MSPRHRPRRLRLAAAPAILAAAMLVLAGCKDAPPRSKQQATVKLLPDTPPPPPPPKPPEVRPPKADQPQPAAKPVEAPPQAQALKTDEAAGAGPGSGLVAGAVTQDYKGGPTGTAVQAGGSAQPADRLAQAAFAQATTRALNEHLAREADLKRREYALQVHLWLTPEGRVRRAEVIGSSGDPDTDAVLRAALARFPGATSPPPDRLPQPLRLQVTNRFLG